MSTFYSMESHSASEAGMAAEGGGGGEDDTAASRDSSAAAAAAVAAAARRSSAGGNDDDRPSTPPPPALPSGLPAAGDADTKPRSKPLSFFGDWKSSSTGVGKKEAAAPPGGPISPPAAAASRLPEAARPDAPLAARAAFIVSSVGQLCLGGGGMAMDQGAPAAGAADAFATPPAAAAAAAADASPSASPPPSPRLLASWVLTASQLRDAARLAAEMARDGGGGTRDVNMTTKKNSSSSSAVKKSNKDKGGGDQDDDGDDDDDGPEFSSAPTAAFAVASPSFGGGRAEDRVPQWRLLLRVRPGARQADVALLLNEGATADAADAAAARCVRAADFGAARGGGGGGGGIAGPPIMSDSSSFGSLVGCTARVDAAVVVRAAASSASASAPSAVCCGSASGGSLQRAFFAGANGEAGFAGARLRLPDEWGLGPLVAGLGGSEGDGEEEQVDDDDEDDDDERGAAAATQKLRALAVAQASEPAVVVAAVLSDVDRVSLAPGAADADHAAILSTLVRPSPAAAATSAAAGDGGGGGGGGGNCGLLPRLVGALSAAQRRANSPTPPPPSPARPCLRPAPPCFHGVRVPSAVRARLERALSPRRSAVVSRSPLMLVADGVLDPDACSLLCGAAASSGALARSRVAHGGETPSRTSRSYFFQKAEALRALAVQVDREILAFARAAAARVGRGPAGPVATCLAAGAEPSSGLSSLGGGGGGGGDKGGGGGNTNKAKGERALERAEQLQIIQYGPDDFYRAHYDHRVGVTLVRNATVLVYLCDTPRGGATWFPNATPSGAAAAGLLEGMEAGGGGGGGSGGGGASASGGGLRVFPRRGRALIFWSTHADGVQDDCSLHSAEEVLEGQKWLASRWLRSE